MRRTTSPSGTKPGEGISRRGIMKVGAGIAAGGLLTADAQAAEPATGRRFENQVIDAKHRILLKGGTIVSLDAKIGDLAKGDVLIEGKKIVAIGPALKADGAQVIDCADSIIIPGFVDCHRHSWEGQLRRINPNAATLAAYSAATHLSFAQHYRPQDMYVGNMITALGCIDAGVTCIIDNSHNARSAGHSDRAIEALIDSGIRAVHASGAPQAGDWEHQWPQDLTRLQKKYFSSTDQLVTLRMFAGPNKDLWALARQLGLRITTEFQGPAMAKLLEPLAAEKLIGPDNTFNHCGALPESTWNILRESGATVDVCPRSDSQYGLGEGFPALQHALDHGIKPGFSVDNETSYSGDMFMEMRVAFHIQRGQATNRKFNGDQNPPAPVSVRDMLECATINGAVCAGLADKIGTLTPGKEADIVIIRADDINLYPSNNAIGTVVAAADTRNIDTVIIGGKVRKFRGKLLGLDMAKHRHMVEESRGYLFSRTGYTQDIFAESFPKLS